MTRTCRILLIPAGVLPLVVFVLVAWQRFVDADEGFYLLASRLVFQHKVPYQDFVYTQMPLLPYVYGSWMRLVGESWLPARLLSVICATVLGLLLYTRICVQTRKWSLGILAVLLFSCSTLVFAWMPIVKTYALSGLLLFASYAIASRFCTTSSNWMFLLAGAALGLSVQVRLYVAAVVPVFLMWVWRNAGGSRQRALRFFLGGLLIAMFPSFWLAAVSPDSFWFNNVGIHAIRSQNGLIGGLGQKVLVLAETLIGGPPGNGVQLGLLFLLGFLLRKRMQGSARLAFHLALVLAAVSLAPTPTYVQYFSIVLPFALVATVCGFSDLLDSAPGDRTRWLAAGFCGIAIYLIPAVPDYRKYSVTGAGINGIYWVKDPDNWRLPAVTAVSRAIDELAEPGEPVMSFWPGYIFASKASPYPGLENETGRTFAMALTSEELTKYHIASQDRIIDEIAARIPRIVVLGNQEYRRQSKQPYAEALARSEYHIARTIGDTSIYVCRDPVGKR